MSTTGLTCSPSRLSFCIKPSRGSGFLLRRVSSNGSFRGKRALNFGVDSSTGVWRFRHTHKIKSAMGASFGDTADDSMAVFPRINIRDPYKRLGISREASEEEIQAARNFLINRYATHKPSIDAIESAHDKIIMQKFYERKNPKINIKKKMREVSQSRVVQAVGCCFLWLLAVGYPVDGVCDSAFAERSKEFRSDDLSDNICTSLGFFYLPQIVVSRYLHPTQFL
ncbi:hypothetical protein MRB53_000943 [Persea americana]|uniref:Uncharacterized protein n=1 Tax=Persea americana TaxID=3435 RepID=A0ACC2MQA9_PERAE|nr:hypothetical protein MRB53_000943 [Persea americana]